MNAIKFFAICACLGLMLVSCSSKGTDQAEQTPATSADAAPTDNQAADQGDVQAPPFSADQLGISVRACEMMMGLLTEQIMAQENALSKTPDDKALADVVAKLKESQILFSQVKGKLANCTEDKWQEVYAEFQRAGIGAKAVLKPLMRAENGEAK